MTTPIIPIMIAMGAKNDDVEAAITATTMKKSPPMISLMGVGPIIALEVPGGGGGMTTTGGTGGRAKANPQLLQNWAPGMNGVPHCEQTDNVASILR